MSICHYVGFYSGKQVEIDAENLLDAKNKAVKHFKVRPNKAHMVSVVLVGKDGEQKPVTSTF